MRTSIEEGHKGRAMGKNQGNLPKGGDVCLMSRAYQDRAGMKGLPGSRMVCM